MRIGVDIDDVLFPWFDKAHQACEAAGITNGRSPSSWECYKDYGVTLETWLAVMEAVTLDGSLYSGDPFPGAVDGVQALVEAGHSVHIVTARGFFAHGERIRQATVDWLHEHRIPHHSLTFTKDKTLVSVDVAVDDSVKNVMELAAAGVDVCMVDAPHNLEHEHPWRVSSFVAFAEAVLA